jgi:hypothetical protein
MAAFAPILALAGRPLTTEDADTLDDKACQVEAWVDHSRVETQAWMVPACNFGLGVEWQAGFSRAWSDGASRFPEAYVQAKSAWGTLGEGGWSVGLVGGVVRRTEERTGWENPYALGVVSWAVGESPTRIHLNAGWSRNKLEGRNAFPWGAAIERPVSRALTLLAESFGENHGKPFFRMGGRYAAIENRLDFDLSVVTRSGANRSDRFISLGFHAQADRILP